MYKYIQCRVPLYLKQSEPYYLLSCLSDKELDSQLQGKIKFLVKNQ